MFLVAKDRAESGIVPDFNLYENISLPFLRRLSEFGVVQRQAERALARRQIAELGIVCRSERDAMGSLSGGNQQKVMVGRWMSQAASLLLLDEPFQGVDIAARRDIAAKLRANAAGRATLIFVTELDEALETADRILVMSEQTLVGQHINTDIDLERLLAWGGRARPARCHASRDFVDMTSLSDTHQASRKAAPEPAAASPSATASWCCWPGSSPISR